MPGSIAVTFFSDHAANTTREETLAPGDLACRIAEMIAPEKARLPWLKLATFGTRRTDKNSLRHDGNVIAISGIELDYDGELVTFDDAIEIAEKAGLAAVVYTSPSHTDDKPRWRLLCPTSVDLPPQDRAHLVSRVNGLYCSIFAAESWTLSQAYYYGAVAANTQRAHRVEVVDGTPIDLLDELDRVARGKPNGSAGAGANGASGGPFGEEALAAEIISGRSYHTASVRLVGKWAQSGIPLLEAQRKLEVLFDQVFPPDRDRRWHDRRVDIPRIIRDIYGKEANHRDGRQAHEYAGGAKRSWSKGYGDAASALCFAVNAWLNRDLPQPDFLMGEWASTTSRGLLVSDTGLGKTNFCLALAFAMALGRDFLHWKSGRPCRVLYIDGEMSRRLMKTRLADAIRRAGAVPETLFAVSRDDLPDMPPLNTAEGQRFVDDLIEKIGGADFVFFDNVQSLIPGDMKEEEPWQQTLPWIRDLTRRSIGQLWIHHTGHDTTRSYGTKTREWQLDTVILLEATERPDADIAFVLKFTKARERAPDNRGNFDKVTITLANDQWAVEGGSPRAGKPPSPVGKKFHAALLDALATSGEVSPYSADRMAVTLDQWKSECTRLGLLNRSSEKRDKARDRALFSKYRLELIAANLVVCNGDFAWPIGQYS